MMAQLIKFKKTLIKISSANSAHLLKSEDRGRTWQKLFNGSELMQSINDIACDDERILVDTCRGFFISTTGYKWGRFEEFKNNYDLKKE